MTLGKTMALVSELFKDKTDKAGEPYIFHCIKVMKNLHTRDVELKIIALLHDVVEDTHLTVESLWGLGYSERVINAVKLLTHNKSIPYMEYIESLTVNADAVQVKLADLKHNSDITRLKGISDKDIERMKKYHKAWLYLTVIYPKHFMS